LKKIPDPHSSGDQRYSAGTSLEWFHEGTFRLLDHDPAQLGRATITHGGKATDHLYFPRHIKDLIQEVRAWHGLKEWYVQRNIPWKRGWCLYGPPGTGKTALVRAIAEDLDMPLFVYSLGHMMDRDLELSWADMQAHTPCVALFEDFDTVFHGRENVYGKPTLADQIAGAMPNASKNGNAASALDVGKLSFGCLLNCIDGADKGGGIFLVITTNHVETLDPALGQPRRNPDGSVDFISTRPGRIDKAIELGYMEREDKKRLARRIFFDDEYGYRLMLEQIEREPNKKETPAQLQEACAQLALALLWGERKRQPPRASSLDDLAVGKLVNGCR
jgi:SpoVK/Ycf46/Vps4 family AAA+-type ATPase